MASLDRSQVPPRPEGPPTYVDQHGYRDEVFDKDGYRWRYRGATLLRCLRYVQREDGVQYPETVWADTEREKRDAIRAGERSAGMDKTPF